MLDFMARLDKNDSRTNELRSSVGDYRDYFQSLEKERLVEVATNLHQARGRAMGKAARELGKQLPTSLFGQSLQQSRFGRATEG